MSATAPNGIVPAVQSTGGTGQRLIRTISHALSRQSTRRSSRYSFTDDEGDDRVKHSKADQWEMMEEVKEAHAQTERDQMSARKLGVTWKDLSVYGVGADVAIQDNVFSQFDVAAMIKKSRNKAGEKTILDNTSGCVKPGEMLLVLGRPGSGCTTLLNILANHRTGYTKVEGDVRFGAMSHKEAERYRGQIVMNSEEELFFPALTVGQTMDFATRMKVPFHIPSTKTSPEEYRLEQKDFLLRSMGIAHTVDTKVGDEYVRGVSGGERKRVSIIETLAARGSVYCWDNSTRGLDASTALQYTLALRAMTDVLGLATVVTLYQAGNGIYNLFDKVLVLDEGKEIFFGPLKEARPWMEELGFMCPDGGNVADFLTGVTVPTERRIRSDMKYKCPKNATDIRGTYLKSDIFSRMESTFNYPDSEEAQTNTEAFKTAVTYDQHKGLPKHSPLTTSFLNQVRACIRRQYQILWGEKETFLIKQGSTLVQALVSGSLFYAAPNNSSGLFIKGGALFFALLFNALLAMSEVTDSFTGRPVLAKHKSFAFYHPAAFCIAQVAADIPVLLFQVSMFSVVLYFMVGLTTTAPAFFTFWIVVFSTAMTMTACFRSIGAGFPTFDAASKVSGFVIAAYIIYTGYMINKGSMHPWFVWIYWIDPMAYGFEALLGNEFYGKIIPCVNNNLVPNGPGYTNLANQACTGVGGALPGATSVTGAQYLASLKYSHSHLWRNLGIIWAWWAFFVALTVFFTSRWKSSADNGRSLLVPAELVAKNVKLLDDEESQMKETPSGKQSPGSDTEIGSTTEIDEKEQVENEKSTEGQLVRNTSVFTWKNLKYTVNTPSGDRVLLDDVQGWVKPGMLGALMGSSGAGKTTLLDVLAQRKTDGKIQGSILVDGRPLSVSFQRSAAYCEQLDVHEPLSTVKEALEFSALLRQSRDTPDEEKLRYVDTIIDLLELHDIKNTLIGTTGAGLSVEQRKRLTIGVELVAKPSILTFLDEPTSGLDGQAAFNTVRFLRKLADNGQAVLVTIHQPSASLFAQFDTLLLLAKGGKTVYFGDIGDNAKTIKEYFGRYDAPCPKESNPAEHMIDVVSGSLSKGKDWNKVWLDSPEYKATVEEVDRIISDAAAKEPGTKDDGHEFATSLATQTKLVTRRMNTALYRNVDYINNKFALHIGSALFNGFTFWMIGDSLTDLQLVLFTVFNFIFVAPGVLAQLQPLFIERRNIYEAREKKSKMYSWVAFCTALIVSEIPYLLVCGVLYFACWYYTAGLTTSSTKAGAVLFVMLIYEFIYTGIGQFVAAYAPNAVFASLVNPVIIGVLVSFCGVLVPYAQIQSFWRYWLYWIDVFGYLMGSILTFVLFDKDVTCTREELAIFDPPAGQTCGAYLSDYKMGMGARTNLLNPTATSACEVCQYSRGSDYLYTLNLLDYYYGWRDAAICVIFASSSYALVYALMKLRTKASRKAE